MIRAILIAGMSLAIFGDALGQSSSVPSLRERMRASEVAPIPRATVGTLSRSRPDPLAITRGAIQNELSSSQARLAGSTVEFYQGKVLWACGTVLQDRMRVVTKASRFQGTEVGERIVGKQGALSLPFEVVRVDPVNDLLFLRSDERLAGDSWEPSRLLEEADAAAWVGALVSCGEYFGIVSVGQRPVSLIERTAHEARVQKFHDRMKVQLSERRSDFPAVIETDLPLLPEDVGRPVVDLEGRVIGIAIARATLNASYVMPLSVIE